MHRILHLQGILAFCRDSGVGDRPQNAALEPPIISFMQARRKARRHGLHQNTVGVIHVVMLTQRVKAYEGKFLATLTPLPWGFISSFSRHPIRPSATFPLGVLRRPRIKLPLTPLPPHRRQPYPRHLLRPSGRGRRSCCRRWCGGRRGASARQRAMPP